MAKKVIPAANATAKKAAVKTDEKASSKKISITQEELKSLVEKRAFEIFLERGCGHGDHDGDWYRAEKEVKSKLKIK